uniref:CASP C-terminal domain-containing protein n=1 Tax=Araucaria cunninghamii TaxID=56994 RepID=A0A0D6R1V9_ARACU
MEHELTQLKVKLSEKTTVAEASEARVKELGMKVDEQQKLISKLEEDILKGYSSIDRRMTKPDDWDLPELGISEILENTEKKKGHVDEEQNSMLQVICSQRDRFRQRLREAEEDLRKAREKINALEADLEKCKADNVKLYEKIRYIQDYTKDWPVSRGLKKRADDIESGFSSDVESKYKKIYEDDINPFAAFSKKEKERRYKELGIRDKITLTSGRFLLGNKYARTFIFFYSIGLHLLVFTSLYRMSALSYKSGGLVSEKTGVPILKVTMPHST